MERERQQNDSLSSTARRTHGLPAEGGGLLRILPALVLHAAAGAAGLADLAELAVGETVTLMTPPLNPH